MNIEKQYQDDHSVKLIVELDQKTTDDYKRRAASKLSARNKIPGFRPGKAPYDIVARAFGEGAISEQAIDMFIDAEYGKILEEAQVEPGAPGTLESVDGVSPFKLTFRVPLAPEVDLSDYHAIRLPYEWVAPGESDVEAALEELRQMYSTTENVDRPADFGDFLLLDVKSETPELNRTGFAAFIRKEDRGAEWPYNGFARELVGLKAGESKTIQHTFPEDWDLEELRGKTVEITATVKIVRGVILPDLDDELAKKTGAGETVEDLKKAVQQDVERRSRDAYDDKYFVDLIEKIKESATIKYHAHELEHESEHVLQDLAQRLAQQGMELDTYLKMRNTTREEFIENEVKPVAKKRLERSLIIDAVVRREKLQVDNESLQAEYGAAVDGLIMQGFDPAKIPGGKKGQERFGQALAMEAAGRVMTRKALETLKSIAMGEYQPPEEKAAEKEAPAEPKPETESGAEEQPEA